MSIPKQDGRLYQDQEGSDGPRSSVCTCTATDSIGKLRVPPTAKPTD